MKKLFAILSLPRSGSHMLASALDSHPDIRCTGEYGMTDKFPIGLSPGSVEGAIVQGYHIERQIAPNWLDQAKIIRLTRPIEEIALSQYRGSPSGQNAAQYLEPTTDDRIRYTVEPNRYDELYELSRIVDDYAKQREHLTLSYRSLCSGADVRTIRWEVMHMICEFLEVTRHPLTPATHKPS